MDKEQDKAGHPSAKLVAGIALVCVLVVGAAVLLLGGAKPYELRVRMTDASQLVKGNLVKVGGVKAGVVKDIELTPSGGAEIRLEVEKPIAPLHLGTTATVRVSSLSSIANRFVSLKPGPNSAPEIGSGDMLPERMSTPSVEIDEVLNTLDADSRDALQKLIKGSAATYEGREAEANAGLKALDPAVNELSGTLAELGRDNGALNTFVVASAATVRAIASRDPDLATALRSSATTATALASERTALQRALTNAPGTLKQAATTVRDAGQTARKLLPTARKLAPVAPRASRLLAQATPFFGEATPVLRQLDGVLPAARRTLTLAPALQRSALPAFASLGKAAEGLTPIVTGLRPYLPDFVGGIINGFGNVAAGYYDANGDYARVAPVVSTASVTGALNGVTKLLTDGSAVGAKQGNDRRCPGGAAQAPDGSGNVDPSKAEDGQTIGCDPAEVP